jgi:hypothetical protein
VNKPVRESCESFQKASASTAKGLDLRKIVRVIGDNVCLDSRAHGIKQEA